MSYYLALVGYGYARLKAYPSEILMLLIEKMISLCFLLVFWSLVIKESSTSFTLREALSYFLIIDGISTIFLIRSQKFGSMLRKSIKSGEISNFLIKPINVILSMYATTLGERSVGGFVSILFIVGGIILNPPQKILSLLLFGLFVALAAILGFAVNLFEGVITFYTTEPAGIMNMISHIIKIFSGFWIPLNFFPSAMKKIVEMTPFPYMLYIPYQSLRFNSFDNEVFRNFGISLFWSISLTLMMYYFWRKGLARYEAIGI